MLTPLQRRIAAILATVPEAEGFALAGGGAMLLRGLVDRHTEDLDFFATDAAAVDRLLPRLEAALRADDLTVERRQVAPGFARILVTAAEDTCLVDLAWDFRLAPEDVSTSPPVLAEEDLAADKTLALFNRAEARDYVDVFALAGRHGRERLQELAARKDTGFQLPAFAAALAARSRLRRDEFEVDDGTFVRLQAYFGAWHDELAD